mmetsp:Transcript_9178/g.13074  ORF Transcript_9178/g.13074 Transcript_9178/m.13074 type:complete len:621 (-) Transcript_9178:4115-5977(-)
MNRQKSLILSESAFHDAAIEATSHNGDITNDDPNALHDTEAMVAIARIFLTKMCPKLIEVLDGHSDQRSSQDRLVKIGRCVSSTMRHARRSSSSLTTLLAGATGDESKSNDVAPYSKSKVDSSLRLLSDECSDLAAVLSGEETRKVPKVRFGKTELQMPVLTLGCMRFQQSWNHCKPEDQVLDMSKVEDECQDNLVEIIKYAYHCGVNHIETAQGYGSSQLQIGFALRKIFDSGEIKREDLIIQTKGGVSASMTPEDYKKQVLSNIELLQLEYIDLFSVHGLNTELDYNKLFNNGDQGNLITALHELRDEGKLRHIGFSTHGPADMIQRAIETDEFDYVNLHYHFCGSYTASGDLEFAGNLSNVRLAKQKDMGVFIISAFDKGGRLYAPSNKLRDITLPDMEPMAYGAIWIWQHHIHDAENAPCHTTVVGAARPSDLDQPVLASFMLGDQDVTEKRQRVGHRLAQAMEEAVGKEWVESWHKGVPNAYESNYQTHLTGIVWIYNLIHGWGLLDFAKERYNPMVNNLKNWDANKTKEENIAKLMPGFGWMPGCAVDFNKLNYQDDFSNCPEENKERLEKAIKFVHKWLAPAAKDSETEPEKVPLSWEVAYDMRPWTAYPERS